MNEATHPAVSAVEQVLTAHGIEPRTRWFDDSTSTAVQAADALGAPLGAIVKSLVFLLDGEPLLVLVSGVHRVDTELVGAELGGTLGRASAGVVKEATGQTIGGVAPIGHPKQIRTVVDVSLADYDEIWAAAGHPHAVFPTTFDELRRLTGGAAIRVISDEAAAE
ncbi:YbaK/EbsC family protein [Parafrigoribacterium humi]|jgi:prolyl-tRNA editing enzyme YbaK/EbsC (Cys-tRNA(Pro) deacylase)|uniref:YbaK/EbsC family protein n=1 Tax=Parafrigoribacterium humi TaxID=3144664 RepID=UPI0032EC5863